MNEQTLTIQQTILALAAGKQIQYRIKGAKIWHDLPGNGHQLANHRNFDFRVKEATK